MPAKDYITNGSFETAGTDADNPSGWTRAGTGVCIAGNNDGRAALAGLDVSGIGTYGYRLSSAGASGGWLAGNYYEISQTVDLTDVDFIVFSYAYKANSDAVLTNDAQLAIGAVVVESFANDVTAAATGSDENHAIDVSARVGARGAQ
jgi:hypothetical protein